MLDQVREPSGLVVDWITPIGVMVLSLRHSGPSRGIEGPLHKVCVSAGRLVGNGLIPTDGGVRLGRSQGTPESKERLHFCSPEQQSSDRTLVLPC
jgi:hypothetical protein